MVQNVYLSSNKGMTLSNIFCYFGPYHSKITQQHRHLNIEKWGILTLIYLDLKISWNFLFIFSKIKNDLIFKMQQTRHLQFYQYRNQKYPKSHKFDLKIANIPKWSIYIRFFFTFDIRFSYSGMLGTFLDSFWSNCAKNKRKP